MRKIKNGMTNVHLIDIQPLTIDKIEKIIFEDYVLELSEDSKQSILNIYQ